MAQELTRCPLCLSWRFLSTVALQLLVLLMNRINPGSLLVVTMMIMGAAPPVCHSQQQNNKNGGNHDYYHHKGDHRMQTGPKTSSQYEWEEWDYYQILGLDRLAATSRTRTASIDPKTIRAAYRKQAQIWHPDKLIHQHQHHRQNGTTPMNISTSSINSSTTHPRVHAGTVPSVEESNARFARIAEAYQVLADEEKRKEYDSYLDMYHQQTEARKRYQEQQYQGNTNRQDDWTSYSSSFSWDTNTIMMMDPFRFFEEFFAATSSSSNYWMDEVLGGNDNYINNMFFVPYDHNAWGYGSSDSSSHSHDGQPIQQRDDPTNRYQDKPDRIQEERYIFIDPLTGQDFLRVIQTEEYFVVSNHTRANSNSYYRILAQDFVEQYEPNQRGWVYQPLQQYPFLVEEGYRTDEGVGAGPSNTEMDDNHNGGYHGGDDQKGEGRDYTTTLYSGESLSVGATLRNGPYQATVTQQCQLSLSDTEQKIELWNSLLEVTAEAEVLLQSPFMYGLHCRLNVQGPNLVLSAVSNNNPGGNQHVVWYSTVSDQHEETNPWMNNPKTTSTADYFARLDMDGSLAVYRADPSHLPLGQQQQHNNHHYARKAKLHGPICVTAVGSPVGCSIMGRFVVQLYRIVRRRLRRLLLSILSFVVIKEDQG